MEVAPADLARDVELKYRPGAVTAIDTSPFPERQLGVPPPPQLFDVLADPMEEHDLAPIEPARVAVMEDETSVSS